MVNCPACGTPAKRLKGRGWGCEQCKGVSSTINEMRKYAPRDVVNSLWNAAKSGRYPEKRTCPSCNHLMTAVAVPGESFSIDICTCCAFVWFDAGETAWLPQDFSHPSKAACRVPPEQAQLIALQRIEQIRARARTEKAAPDEMWKYIPALLGNPVEFDCERVARTPYVTLSLMVLITVVSVLGFFGILSPLQFGLWPLCWERLLGLTFFTSFFFHSGWMHLLGNLYFFYVFGDNVEDVEGRTKFLLLLAWSTLVGGLFYVLGNPESSRVCIGASGGISGVLAYYTLRFPKHRIGFLIFFVKWIRFPVTLYFAFWILLQLYGALAGRGGIAYSAHFGGVAAGVAFWAVEWLRTRR